MSDQPSQNLKAEEQAIGSCLVDASYVDVLTGKLRAGAATFWNLKHRNAFSIICSIKAKGEPILPYSVAKNANGFNSRELLTLKELEEYQDRAVPSAIDYWVDQMNAMWVERECTSILSSSQLDASNGLGYQQIFERLQNRLSQLSGECRKSNTFEVKDACELLINDMDRRYQLHGELSGIDTGFHVLNRMTEGFQFGEQAIIASRPSAGKTSMGINIINHACVVNGQPSLFVTLEMSVTSLMRRLLACNKRIPIRSLRSGQMGEVDMKFAASFNSLVSKAPLFFLSFLGGAPIDVISASIRGMVKKHGIKLVVVDYLQKIKASQKQEKRTYEVAEVSGLMKACAVETGAAFVSLAQLSRENERDKGRSPRLSDLADSAQIERDADCVLLIHRPHTDLDPYGENAKIIVAKQRDGETGVFDLKFDGRYCVFENPPIMI